MPGREIFSDLPDLKLSSTRTIRRSRRSASRFFLRITHHVLFYPVVRDSYLNTQVSREPNKSLGAFNSPVGACIPPACSRNGVPMYRGFIGDGYPESRHLALGPTFLLQLFKQIGFDPDLSGMVKKPRLILRVSANPVPPVPFRGFRFIGTCSRLVGVPM